MSCATDPSVCKFPTECVQWKINKIEADLGKPTNKWGKLADIWGGDAKMVKGTTISACAPPLYWPAHEAAIAANGDQEISNNYVDLAIVWKTFPGFADNVIAGSAGALKAGATVDEFITFSGSTVDSQKQLTMYIKKLYPAMPTPFVAEADQTWKNSARWATWFTRPDAGKGGRCVAAKSTREAVLPSTTSMCLESCMSYALSSADYLAFEFNTATKECRMIKQSVAKDGSVTAPTWVNKERFQCYIKKNGLDHSALQLVANGAKENLFLAAVLPGIKAAGGEAEETYFKEYFASLQAEIAKGKGKLSAEGMQTASDMLIYKMEMLVCAMYNRSANSMYATMKAKMSSEANAPEFYGQWAKASTADKDAYNKATNLIWIKMLKAKKAYMVKKMLTLATELKYFDNKANLQKRMGAVMDMMNSFDKVDIFNNPKALMPNLAIQCGAMKKFIPKAKFNARTVLAESEVEMISIIEFKQLFMEKLTAIWVKGIDEMCAQFKAMDATVMASSGENQAKVLKAAKESIVKVLMACDAELAKFNPPAAGALGSSCAAGTGAAAGTTRQVCAGEGACCAAAVPNPAKLEADAFTLVQKGRVEVCSTTVATQWTRPLWINPMPKITHHWVRCFDGAKTLAVSAAAAAGAAYMMA